MGIEKTKVLVCDFVYWVDRNADIENTVKPCATCMEYQQTHLYGKNTPYEMPCKLREAAGADIFSIKNNTLCIVDYYTFSVLKKADGL